MLFACKDRCTHTKRLVAGFDSSPTGVTDLASPEVTWDPNVRQSEGKPTSLVNSGTKLVLARQESPTWVRRLLYQFRKRGKVRRVSLLPDSTRERPWLAPQDPASNCKTMSTGRSDDSQTDVTHEALESASTSGILLSKASNRLSRQNGSTPSPQTHSESPVDV